MWCLSHRFREVDLLANALQATLTATAINVISHRHHRPDSGDWGGYASFEGIIRRDNRNKSVIGIDYECYAALANKELRQILVEAQEEFNLGFAEVVHRTGFVNVGETAVFIQTMARHRHPAIAGCEYIIDQLKKRVPIWKKELYEDGTHDWPVCQH